MIVSRIIHFGKNCWAEFKAKKHYDYCSAVFRQRLEKNNIPADKPAPGEENYIRFWQQFHKRVEPYTYRFFSRLCNNNPHIVPEDIAYRYIESALNPPRYRAYYSDKNMYQHYIKPKSALPKAFLCRIMGGGIFRCEELLDTVLISFDSSAESIASVIGPNVQRVILKPSIDSNSGRGVMLFERNGSVFKHDNKQILSGPFLNEYGPDWIIQEVIVPHPYLQQFSRTSVNTMRIMTYRSMVDESVTVFGAVLRIGPDDSLIDNLFAGGGFVTIDLSNGELGRLVYNKYWQSTTMFNGIDFSADRFVLPFWSIALRFAESIAKQVPHARLLAQDITIDGEGRPRLIEFNVDDFDWAFTMTAGRIPLGDRFNEVIDYCLNK